METIDVYEEIRGLCIEMCRAEPTRLRVVSGECDESTDSAKDAHEFLKLDERRCGRDFKLYGFMAKMGSVQAALADFADVLCVCQREVPKAFRAVFDRVLNWDRFYEPEQREGWRAIWT